MSEVNTNINWYPGHMAKAKREMQEKVKLVDMVIELRDARIPASSVNPVLNEVIGNKPRLVVLAKKDKAENEITKQWINSFQQEGYYSIALDLLHDNASKIISNACQEVMKEKIAKQKARGLKHVEIKAMVVGIPNVGKSTLINNVSKKKLAKTADKPGVTRNLQWIKVSPDVALLDTPGVLWPKFEDPEVGVKLALCGSISDSVIPIIDIVNYGLTYLVNNHPDNLVSRYNIEITSNNEELLNRIAYSRNFLNPNGEADLVRTRSIVLNEFRDGYLGKVSLEKPYE